MRKTILTLVFLFLIIVVGALVPKSVFAQQYCPDENACLCQQIGYPACCEIEGPGGYNCGGGGGGEQCECGVNAQGNCKPCGGFQCPTPVNCSPAERVMTYDITNIDEDWNPRCPVGTSQSYQCTDYGTDEDGNEVCTDGRAITYGCCPTGTQYQCQVVDTGNNYTIYNSCRNPTRCSEDIDVYLYHYEAPNTVANRCYSGENESGFYWVYNVYTVCRDYQRVCNCVATCNAQAPSTPILTSPVDGASLSTTPVSLNWNAVSSWGLACANQVNSYSVYVGTTNPPIPYTNVGTATNYSFSGALGNTYYWFVRASNGQLYTDSEVRSFTITQGPWWQVKDGDVTANGALGSDVPDGSVFADNGAGGYPGLPVYSDSFNLSSNPAKISTTGWQANSLSFVQRLFNFDYFANLIPQSIVVNPIGDLAGGGVSDENGYEWYRVNGNLDIASSINFGNRKVIVFVENGSLNLAGNINLNDGVGFAGFFVEGGINIDPNMAQVAGPELEGVYLTSGLFSTGAGDSQLHIRGSVASYGGFSLQRDLINDSAAPAELFEYGPDQILLFPNKLAFRQSRWVEVAP